MRIRRKPWPNLPWRVWFAVLILFSVVFTYVIFFCASNLHAPPARRFPLILLDWLKSSPETSHRDDRNTLHKDFDFVIRVLAFNRLPSLKRCLRSLAAADYGGDRVDLLILVDHFEATPLTARQRRTLLNSTEEEEGLIDEFLEDRDEDTEVDEELSSDPVERNLQQARQILRYLDKFRWRHGSKQVHYRAQNLGLQGQWIESWWPASEHQFAFIVEDDMQLSPLFYRYVRCIIANYYYNLDNFDPSIFGVTLQRPRFVPGKRGSPIQLKNTTRLFLYQMVGSWGQVLFPGPWKEFRLWFEEQKTRSLEPILEGMKTTDWYRRRGNNLWTPWFTKFAHSRGYFNIYTNFLRNRSLSVSHRVQGVNYKKEAGPDSELIRRRGLSDINLWQMPPLGNLTWYDYCFHPVLRNRLVNGSEELRALLPGLHSGGEVVVVSIGGAPEGVVRNWLCSTGARNLLLVGTEGELARELARRGYAVAMELSPVRVLREVVELGYSVWFARPESSLVRGDLTGVGILGVVAGVGDGAEGFHRGLMFVRSNEEAKGLLRDLEGSGDEELGRSLWRAASNRGLEIGKVKASVATRNESGNSTILLFNEEANGLMELLKSLELWLVDEELACKRVSCT